MSLNSIRTLGRAGGGLVVDVPVVQIVDVGIQFLGTVIDMPAVVHVVFVVLKTVEVPQLQNLTGGRCPCCAGRRLGLLLEVPQTQFIARIGRHSSVHRDGGLH